MHALIAIGLALSANLPVSGPVDYVALGDSYAAGSGASGTNEGCGRRAQSYPALWAATHDVASYRHVACADAVTADVLSDQIAALNAGTDLVTITVGGNDIGFVGAAINCVLFGDSRCLEAVADANTAITGELPGRLDEVYTAIREAAPHAEVVVLGYPRLFESGACPGGLSATKRQALNTAADRLDAVIADRAAAAGFTFGDVRDAFAGHGVCASEPWLNRVNLLALTATYHPNDAGYAGGYLPTLAAITG
ncbi:lysophospholipase L1-like esterase [Actinoplanes lutulentus]|uniref:Lysophospholipase L1-like esterase n=1 Tax=Actinoplanes lutulentus TaxID=1287878 RepID=A0A327Z557_9ACTN|nr:SGNH/GDSL hydrolase family protein [Actinoplanes lutulentus]MBB2949150.1 lysophospholipase L1-like esterase [Actinoplanes lutulentus]RAK31471.1 lysophospholipase L1-like esterase [Actinoplanes lutulentus]